MNKEKYQRIFMRKLNIHAIDIGDSYVKLLLK